MNMKGWWAAVGPLVMLGAIGLGPISPALADETPNHPAIGDTTVFANVPAPGHPFGVAVDSNRVYISTSAGDFFADRAPAGLFIWAGERGLAYDKEATLFTPTTSAPGPTS